MLKFHVYNCTMYCVHVVTPHAITIMLSARPSKPTAHTNLKKSHTSTARAPSTMLFSSSAHRWPQTAAGFAAAYAILAAVLQSADVLTTAVQFSAVGSGYCVNVMDEWPNEKHTGFCITLAECEQTCLLDAACAGFSFSEYDRMGHCHD